MAVLESNQTVSKNVSGFDKGIHASARTMMLDNLQGTMYQKPIESAVRECVSNAVDAVKEKNTARKILTGEAKVTDFYLTREDVKDKIASSEDDIYQDSEFNPDYYDLKWLSTDDSVSLKYVVNEQTKRDQFIISDNGVGLGGKRLEGFFSLGYSSKRLNSGELGGFGLGAKSPLSTGVESYRIISRYNGKEYCFDIYSHKVDCVYGKWGDNGNMNKFTEFESVQVSEKFKDTRTEVNDKGETVQTEFDSTRIVPYKAYYKDTTEKNGTTLIIDVKKHNRAKYFEAVSSQLMYLKADITFQEVSQTGSVSNIPFKATILYEDDNIIIPSSTYYQKPHFVLNGVAYGLIDYNEADLAVKQGNVGIKFKMEDLDVVPSRESVRYTPKTAKAIVSQSAEVGKTVEAKIQEELKQTHILDWVRACNKIMYQVGNNSTDIVGRMAALSDSTQLSPVFSDTGIKYTSDVKAFITPMLKMEHKQIEAARNHWGYTNRNKQKRKLITTESTNILNFDKPLYFQFTPSNNIKNHYLAVKHEAVGGFCTIRVAPAYLYVEASLNDFVKGKIDKATFLIEASKALHLVESNDGKVKTAEAIIAKLANMVGLLKGGKDLYMYEDVDVPADFKVTEDGTDSEVAEEANDTTAATEAARIAKYKESLKRRREEKAFIGYQLANKKVNTYYFKTGFERSEMKVADLDFDNCKVVYGTDDDEKAFDLLGQVAKSRGASYDNEAKTYYWDDNLKMVKVAKTNLRYVKNEGVEVEQHLLGVEDGVLKSTAEIRSALTAKSIYEIVTKKSAFLRNFSSINPELHDLRARLQKFINEAPNVALFDKDSGNKFSRLFAHYYDVNLAFIKYENLSEEERTELLDGVDTSEFDIDVLDVDLIDRDILQDALKLEAFAEVYGGILSHIDILSDGREKPLDGELISGVKEIIEARKDQLEYQYKGIN